MKEIKTFNGPYWYADAHFFDGSFSILIEEVEDENSGKVVEHILDNAKIKLGLEKMAVEFPHLFCTLLQHDTDATTADIFLQCCLFGEEKYA